MSRILNRPMFRGGGKVSSYGTGIATGLAKGGSVNTPKRGIVDGPGRYSVSMSGLENYNQIFNNTKNKVIKTGADVVEAAKNKTSQGVGKTRNFLNKSKNFLKSKNFSEKGIMQGLKKLPALGDKLTGYGMKGIKRFPALSFGLAAEYVTRPQDIDKFIYEQEGYGPIEGRFRQILDPTYTSKLTDIYAQGYNEDGKLNALLKEQTENSDPTADAQNKPGVEINVNDKGEPTESRKDRLKRTAKEYQEILGDGIKKDSIFDAMVMGGTSLMEGQGFAQAAREVNKSLDPIQNIKTASRKLALEEDIAMRKAMATAAGKETETSRKIAAMKAGNFTPEQIANAVAGIKTKSIAEEAKDANSKTEGYRNWHIKNEPNIKVTEFTEVKDIEKAAENLPDGVYYVTFPGDTYVKIEGNKVVAKKRRGG